MLSRLKIFFILHILNDLQWNSDYMMVKCLFAIGESCWWTIHPSSKQRSEGEKVRVGDDAILVSVATERYLVNLQLLIYFVENL